MKPRPRINDIRIVRRGASMCGVNAKGMSSIGVSAMNGANMHGESIRGGRTEITQTIAKSSVRRETERKSNIHPAAETASSSNRVFEDQTYPYFED